MTKIKRWVLWFCIKALKRKYACIYEIDIGECIIARYHQVGINGWNGNSYGLASCKWGKHIHLLSEGKWKEGYYYGTWSLYDPRKPWVKPLEFNVKAKHGRLRSS